MQFCNVIIVLRDVHTLGPLGHLIIQNMVYCLHFGIWKSRYSNNLYTVDFSLVYFHRLLRFDAQCASGLSQLSKMICWGYYATDPTIVNTLWEKPRFGIVTGNCVILLIFQERSTTCLHSVPVLSCHGTGTMIRHRLIWPNPRCYHELSFKHDYQEDYRINQHVIFDGCSTVRALHQRVQLQCNTLIQGVLVHKLT